MQLFAFSPVADWLCRINEARQKLSSCLGEQFTTLASRSPQWLLQHTTASWTEKFGQLYPYACIVDVTFLRTAKSGNIWVSKQTHSHYKHGWGVALIRIVATDGTVILNGEPIASAEPKGWANLDVCR